MIACTRRRAILYSLLFGGKCWYACKISHLAVSAKAAGEKEFIARGHLVGAR